MINHLRTLLLNRPSVEARDSSFIGEELMPPGFVAAKLPPGLLALRRVLFGSERDRAFLNFRLAELLGLIHASEFASQAFRHDNRLSYRIGASNTAALLAAPRVTVTPQAGSGELIVGSRNGPTAYDDIIYSLWRLEAVTGSYSLLRLTYPTIPYFGTERTISIPGTGRTAIIPDGDDQAWDISILDKPSRRLVELIPDLERTVTPALFAGPEPYLSWGNAWRKAPDAPLRLSALALALAERTQEAINEQ